MRLAQAAGTQFDTAVVAVFEALLTSSSDGWPGNELSEFSHGHSVQVLGAA